MELKFITLNTLHGGELMESLLEFLKHEKADIVFLQEMYDEQDHSLPPKFRSFLYLKDKLNYEYGDFAPMLRIKLPVGIVTEGIAILSKFPLSNVTNTFFVKSDGREYYQERLEDWPEFPRLLQCAEIDTGAGTLHAINVHGPWDLDGDSPSSYRKAMSEAIITASTGKPNVVVAGDTNAKPTNPAIHPIEKHLKSVFGDELKSSFNMRRKSDPGYATAVVDMVFVSHDIEITAKSCPDVDVSDHLPLIVTMRIR